MKLVTRALAIATLGLSTCAQAVVLPVGVTTPLSGTTVAADPQLAGTVIEDIMTPFSFAGAGGTIFGTVQSRVVRSSVDNTLDFYWRVINDPNSSDAISTFRLGNFYSFVYDADYRIDGEGDVAPDAAHRFSTPSVNFLFGELGGSTLAPGESSNFMFLDTNMFFYARLASYDLLGADGGISGTFSTFTPVPEPGSVALLAGGLGLLALGRRRRV
jgi:hypothetical protein